MRISDWSSDVCSSDLESLARAKELLAAAPMAESQGDRITEATTMQTARLIEMGQLATVDPDGQRADYPIALLLTFDAADSIRTAIREGKVGFVLGAEPERYNQSVQAAPRSAGDAGTHSWGG